MTYIVETRNYQKWSKIVTSSNDLTETHLLRMVVWAYDVTQFHIRSAMNVTVGVAVWVCVV